MSWIATGDDYWEGTATEYDIRISETPIHGDDITWGYWATQLDGEPVPDTSGTPQSWSITGLEQGQTYWIGMKVYDEAGNSSPLKIWQKVAEPLNPPRMPRWR